LIGLLDSRLRGNDIECVNDRWWKQPRHRLTEVAC
jgi:hypothetical protein